MGPKTGEYKSSGDVFEETLRDLYGDPSEDENDEDSSSEDDET